MPSDGVLSTNAQILKALRTLAKNKLARLWAELHCLVQATRKDVIHGPRHIISKESHVRGSAVIVTRHKSARFHLAAVLFQVGGYTFVKVIAVDINPIKVVVRELADGQERGCAVDGDIFAVSEMPNHIVVNLVHAFLAAGNAAMAGSGQGCLRLILPRINQVQHLRLDRLQDEPREHAPEHADFGAYRVPGHHLQQPLAAIFLHPDIAFNHVHDIGWLNHPNPLGGLSIALWANEDKTRAFCVIGALQSKTTLNVSIASHYCQN